MWQKIDDPFLKGRIKQTFYYIDHETESYFDKKRRAYRVKYNPKQVPLYWPIGDEIYLPVTAFYLFGLEPKLPRPNPIAPISSLSHLYSYQVEAIEACLKSPNGIVILPTGSGKTEIFLGLIHLLGLKTLVLAPSNAVRDTLIIRGKKYGMSIGSYSQRGDKQIVVTHPRTVEIAINSGKKLDFELLIIDECHHITKSRLTCIQGINTLRHIYGFTATLDMLDIPDLVIYKNPPITAKCLAYIGPVLFRKTLRELKEYPDFKRELPELLNLEINFPYNDRSNNYRVVARTYLYTKKRLALVSSVANKLTLDYGRKCIVICNNKKVLQRIAGNLKCRWVVWSAKTILSNISTTITPKNAVAKIADLINSDKLDMVLVTDLAKEGVDISNLDACILFDKTSNIPVIQSIGRARAKGKKPLIVNFLDTKGIPARQAQGRRNILLKAVVDTEKTLPIFAFLNDLA